MSKYTITIKNLIDNGFSFSLSNYPIFDDNYRTILNNKILNHYYMNEIGFETAELFNFYLENTMNEIMPYYNELYKAQQKIINNLFDNLNITEIFTKNLNELNTQNINNIGNSSSNSTSNTNLNNKSLYQDTPQGKISMEDLENQKWATNASMDKNTNNSTINDTSNTSSNTDLTNDRDYKEDYTKTIKGSNGMYNIDILLKIKQQLLNIDLMIISDLNDLFMGLM
ncbi:MAG: hypothetical protein OSJ63_05595 [Bacilli bacterium]|nr:hypothetical protein [Bacilli bacterium]